MGGRPASCAQTKWVMWVAVSGTWKFFVALACLFWGKCWYRKVRIDPVITFAFGQKVFPRGNP